MARTSFDLVQWVKCTWGEEGFWHSVGTLHLFQRHKICSQKSMSTVPITVHPNVAYPPSIRIRLLGRAPKL